MGSVPQLRSVPSSTAEYASDGLMSAVGTAVTQLQEWIEIRDYAGYEPYDILNSPLFSAAWLRRPPVSWAFIQVGKRWGGESLRRLLRVPISKNPKALALMLAGYCDRLRSGETCPDRMNYVKSQLALLRSPEEDFFCWGYDWDFVSLRGTVLPAFRPNVIATVFAGQALLDMVETTGDLEAAEMASSVGRFIVTRLRRPIDTAADLCFSYTPWDQTRIYNGSALAAAFLARLGRANGDREYLELSRRAMHYLIKEQRPDGYWFYGAGRAQRWIDGFHTGYNLEAMIAYRQGTGDGSVDDALGRGYNFYVDHLFDDRGVPKYLHDTLYPIDIHCCSQAILTFAAYASENPAAWQKALEVTEWSLNNMRTPSGHFAYQIHRWWRDETPYMRWAQAWMFRALARLQRGLRNAYAAPTQTSRTNNPSESRESLQLEGRGRKASG